MAGNARAEVGWIPKLRSEKSKYWRVWPKAKKMFPILQALAGCAAWGGCQSIEISKYWRGLREDAKVVFFFRKSLRVATKVPPEKKLSIGGICGLGWIPKYFL